jgi:hypothetical protein
LPLDLSASTVKYAPSVAELGGVEPETCFQVSTLRREMLFQCDSEGERALVAARCVCHVPLSVSLNACDCAEEARRWVRALRNQADTAIKVRLGHLHLEGPEEEARTAGDALLRRREGRLRRAAETPLQDPAASAETAGLLGVSEANWMEEFDDSDE